MSPSPADDVQSLFTKTRRDLIFPVGTVFAISVIIISALVLFAANRLNQVSEDKSVHLARSVIAGLGETLDRMNVDSAYWDQAVEKLVYDFDPVWAEDNIGAFLHESFDVYSSYVIDAENRTIYSAIEGEGQTDDPIARLAAPFETLVEQARTSAPFDAVPLPISGFVRDDDQLLLVSATRLTTYANVGGEEISTGTRSVLVMTQDLNAELLGELGENYLLSDFRLDLSAEQSHTGTALALSDVNAAHLGTLLWDIDHPGTEMLKWMAPVIAALFLLMGGLVYLSVSRANRVSHSILLEVENRHEVEQALIQARKVQALGNLAGGVAHNFNNLLQPILMLALSLRKAAAENSTARQDLDVMIEACNRGADLVEQISVFTRENNHSAPNENIFKVVNQGLKLASSTIPTSITVSLDLDENTGTVLMDATETLTVLMNLVSNAVDAMQGHVGTLSVALSPTHIGEGDDSPIPELPKGAYAHLSVSDTGVGMDQETLSRAFDPFFTTKDVGEGTGLGLSTTYGIVSRRGGVIHTTSTPQKGSTIDVYLPLAGNGNTPGFAA